MKKEHVCLAAAWIIGGLTLVALDSNAAENKTGPPVPVNQTGKTVTNAPLRLEPLSQKLGLTLEQQEKLKPILQEEWKKIREFNARTDLTPEQKFQEKQKLLSSTIVKVKEIKIMTDEQYAKWKQIRDQQLSPPPNSTPGDKTKPTGSPPTSTGGNNTPPSGPPPAK